MTREPLYTHRRKDIYEKVRQQSLALGGDEHRCIYNHDTKQACCEVRKPSGDFGFFYLETILTADELAWVLTDNGIEVPAPVTPEKPVWTLDDRAMWSAAIGEYTLLATRWANNVTGRNHWCVGTTVEGKSVTLATGKSDCDDDAKLSAELALSALRRMVVSGEVVLSSDMAPVITWVTQPF